jgi:hypothetical protein
MFLKAAVAVAGIAALLPIGALGAQPGVDPTVPPKSNASASARSDWVSGGARDKKATSNASHSGSRKPHVNTQPATPTAPPCNPWKGWCPGRLPLFRLPDEPGDAKPSTATETRVREVAAKLKLPNSTPRFGPDPSVNEWNMLVVGYSIWLWTDRPTRLTTTAHNDGLSFTLTATWTSTTFAMGDGHTKTCAATSVYPTHIDKPGSPSPTCGYVYDITSPIGHPYIVTATTHWQIEWHSDGEHGTFEHTTTGNRTLEIGELHSLIKG